MKSDDENAALPNPKSYGLERIDIILDDNEDGVFMCGQTIKGNIVLELEQPVKAKGVRIRCKGEARVNFTDRSVGIRRKFAAEESYLHLEPYLFGDGESEAEVSSGTYPFELALSDNLPCSFEGFYGRIRYSLRASLVLNERVVLSSSALPFTLAALCDLNQDSLAPLPISENQSKTFIGQRDALRMEVGLPVRGFVPGQMVPMTVALKNESNVRVAKIRVLLKKVVTYHAKEKSRIHKEVVVEMELPVSRNDETFKQSFDVPSIPPNSGLSLCKIIDVRYTLKVEACVDLGEWYYRMLQKNLKVRTNIIIGTVPLKNYEDATDGRKETARANGVDDIVEAEISDEQQYEKSRIYRSSKPDRDDPTGDEGDSDGAVMPYSPMYRVYKFDKKG